KSIWIGYAFNSAKLIVEGFNKDIALAVLSLCLDRPTEAIKPSQCLIPVDLVYLLPHLYKPLICWQLSVRVWNAVDRLGLGRGKIIRINPDRAQHAVILSFCNLSEIILYRKRQSCRKVVGRFGSRYLVRPVGVRWVGRRCNHFCGVGILI